MNYPKIGIRPIIEGRLGGVRKSLEAPPCKWLKCSSNVYKGIHYCPVKICNKIAVSFTGQAFYRKKIVYKKLGWLA